MSGNKAITSNGTNIDVTSYKTVSVNVPIPSGYVNLSDMAEYTVINTEVDTEKTVTITPPSGYSVIKTFLAHCAPYPSTTGISFNGTTFTGTGRALTSSADGTCKQYLVTFSKTPSGLSEETKTVTVDSHSNIKVVQLTSSFNKVYGIKSISGCDVGYGGLVYINCSGNSVYIGCTSKGGSNTTKTATVVIVGK